MEEQSRRTQQVSYLQYEPRFSKQLQSRTLFGCRPGCLVCSRVNKGGGEAHCSHRVAIQRPVTTDPQLCIRSTEAARLASTSALLR